jgi:hypothetical protein
MPLVGFATPMLDLDIAQECFAQLQEEASNGSMQILQSCVTPPP